MPNPSTSSVKRAPARRSTPASRPSPGRTSTTRVAAGRTPQPASRVRTVKRGPGGVNSALKADARNARIVTARAQMATRTGSKVRITKGEAQSLARLQSVQRSTNKGFLIGGAASFVTLGSPLVGLAAGGLIGAKSGAKNTYGGKGSGRQLRKALKAGRQAKRATRRNVRTLRDSQGRFAGSARI